MDLLLILTYAALCTAVFKIFRIPINKWSVPTAVLGGIVLIGSMIFLMNYNHPYSELGRMYFVSTPIVPVVSGQVIEVPAQNNVHLDKGAVLFKLDPTPFANTLKSIDAQLVSARADQARARELAKRNVGNKRDVDLMTARVDDLQAQRANAQFNLDSTIMRAPSAGLVTQVSLRPGMYAMSMPLRPSMVFVPEESYYFVAWMRQNSQLRLMAGDEAEVAFDGIPGQVFQAKVRTVLPVIAEGQVQPSGTLISAAGQQVPGRVPVVLDIVDPAFEAFRAQVPGGAYAQAAIYSKHFHHVAVMRKILLRMSAWMNYIFPFH